MRRLASAKHRKYLNERIANRSDIVDFEVYPLITSKEAADRVLKGM